MKNMQIGFSKVFRTAITVVVFGLVLGAFTTSLSKANAQQVVEPAVELGVTPGTIDKGASAILDWSSIDASSVSITPGVGSNLEYKGERTISPTQTTTYTITGTNPTGGRATASVTLIVRDVQDQDNNPTLTLTVDNSRIKKGESTTLRWNSENASKCTASGDWSGDKTLHNGIESTGSLNSVRTYTYNLTCRNEAGNSVFKSVSVQVTDGTTDNNGQGPDVTTKSATNIQEDEATLRGEVDGNGLPTRVWFQYSRVKSEVADCDTDHDCEETDEQSTGSGTKNFDDQTDNNLRPNTTYYFRAAARNSKGTDYGSILSFRTDDNNTTTDRTCRNTSATNYGELLPCRYITNNTLPTVKIYADSQDLAYNGSTFIRWTTSNATSCYASGGSTGWTGAKSIGPASFYTGSLTSSKIYTLTCSNSSGSATDSVPVTVRGRTIVTTTTRTRPAPTSLVLITSSIDRNQPIQPTLDNTRPHVGDEINYTVTYQNIGTAAITNLTLRLDLPREVDYMFSNPNNPIHSGNTLIFNLGSLPANGEGTVTVRVRVREDAPAGALLNFPAVLSYTDPAGFPQSVSANVSAQVWNDSAAPLLEENNTPIPLGASVFGAGFWPTSLFGWLLFLILILVLIMLVRSLFTGTAPILLPRKTVTTTVQH